MESILIATIVKSPNGQFHRIIVTNDYKVKVFVTNEEGASKNWGPILVEEMKGKTNMSKLAKAHSRHGCLVMEFVSGTR